jgi:Tol biopolymer transport system component
VSSKRITGFFCLGFICINLLVGCSTHPTPIETLPAQTPSQIEQTPIIFVKPQTPTQVIPTLSPTSSPTIASTSYPLEGEIYFLENANLIVVDASTGKSHVLLEEPSVIDDPIPASTGFVYFLYGGSSGQDQLYRIKMDGSDLKRLTYDADYDNTLAVSTDGSRIAYNQNLFTGGDTETISVIDYRHGGVAGGVYSSVTKVIQSLSWSNNGEKLAFFLWNEDVRINEKPIYGDLYIMNSNGTNLTKIKSDLPLVMDTPTWSPDDSQLAVPAYDNTGVNLYVIDVKSQTMKKITDSNDEVRYPNWSPSSNKILFMQGTNYYTVAPNGTNLLFLADHAPDPNFAYKSAAWSPDGHYVAITRYDSLFIVNAEGGAPFQLSIESPSNISWIKSAQP